ncbi:MAG: transposase [Candidatus Heimdallarchaeota archaeon]|nr:transposase [Candidatus Heimdallarchaeota archaeon]
MVEDLSEEEIDKVIKQLPENKSKQILTVKLQINPTKEQQKVLWGLAENCRLIYNFALKERLDWWERNKDKVMNEREEFIAYNKQQNDLPKLKEQFPRYKQNYSKTLQMTLKEVDSNYKSFFTLKGNGESTANPPSFKGKKYFTSIIYNQFGFKFENNEVVFNHNYLLDEITRIDLRFSLSNGFSVEDKKIKQIIISYNKKRNEFFLSIQYEVETPLYIDNGIYQAFDQGIINLLTGVNNHAGKTLLITNPRINNYWQPNINELKSKRDHCIKFSNRWYWYNDKLKKIISKQKHQLKDFQHKMSKKIITNTQANTILIGDLKVKEIHPKENGNKKSDRTMRRNQLNSGNISRLAGFLTYKAQKVGKKVIRISERRTTQRCCFCGKKEQRMLSERIIHCDKCGLVIDRDVNGAVNILQRFFAILTLSYKRPLVGQQLLNDFRKLFFAIHSSGICQPANAQQTRKQS